MQKEKRGKEKSDEEGHRQAGTDSTKEARARQVMEFTYFSGRERSSLRWEERWLKFST